MDGPDHIPAVRSKSCQATTRSVVNPSLGRTFLAIAPRNGAQAGYLLLGFDQGSMALGDSATRTEQPVGCCGKLLERRVAVHETHSGE